MKKISREVVYLGDFREETLKLLASDSRTDRFPTGIQSLDDFLFGGIGQRDNYEIVVIYGDTGIGKSTITANIVANAITTGTRVGLAILEDKASEFSKRMLKILGEQKWEEMNKLRTVEMMPSNAVDDVWELSAVIDYFKHWFERGIEVVVLDHIQFAFENATLGRGENEYNAQRIFMRHLNALVKRYNGTAILVSHINKSSTNKGMAKIQGSAGIAGIGTKVIEIEKDKETNTPYKLWLRKSRHTPERYEPYMFHLENQKIRELSPKEQPGASARIF